MENEDRRGPQYLGANGFSRQRPKNLVKNKYFPPIQFVDKPKKINQEAIDAIASVLKIMLKN